MKKLNWILASLALVLVVGCGTSQPSGGGNANSDGRGDTTDNATSDFEEDSGSVEISIPLINDPPPRGVFEQLSWAGAGGGEEDPNSCLVGRCWLDWQDGDVLILREFDPDQRLVLLFYRTAGENVCGFLGADYATGYYVDVDSSGSREVHISGLTDEGFLWDPGVVFLYQVLDGETWEPLWAINLGKQFPC